MALREVVNLHVRPGRYAELFEGLKTVRADEKLPQAFLEAPVAELIEAVREQGFEGIIGKQKQTEIPHLFLRGRPRLADSSSSSPRQRSIASLLKRHSEPTRKPGSFLACSNL